MDLIEKISLKDSNEKDAVLDNNALSDEQKVIMYNEIFKKQLLKKQPAVKAKKTLLSRLWSSIENLPKHQRAQARDLVQKIENFPNLTINPRFEMVYKGVPQHGTNIIRLILNHVTNEIREILPGQDLLENIAAFNERLFYVPGIAPKSPTRLTSKKLSNPLTFRSTTSAGYNGFSRDENLNTPSSFFREPSPQRLNRKSLSSKKPRSRSPFNILTPHHPVSRGVSILDFSPHQTRSRQKKIKTPKNEYRENLRWQR